MADIRDMKYRVEIKPVGKYKPLYEAGTKEEIKAWLTNPLNVSWRYYGSGVDYKKVQSKRNQDLAVTQSAELADTMDDNDSFRRGYTETAELRQLTTCERGDEVYVLLK